MSAFERNGKQRPDGQYAEWQTDDGKPEPHGGAVLFFSIEGKDTHDVESHQINRCLDANGKKGER